MTELKPTEVVRLLREEYEAGRIYAAERKDAGKRFAKTGRLTFALKDGTIIKR
jgi:hypothetical protein